MTVLFTSSRPLGRCENLTAVYDAFDGPKRFERLGYGDSSPFGDCRVVVSDEFLQRKGAGQVLVKLDHGISGGKRYGLDQPHGVYTREACQLVDWCVTSSEHTRIFDSSSCGIPIERVLPLGMPRTDAYAGKRKGDGGTFLAEFARAYLFAPTFRASWEPNAPRIDWKALDANLGDGEVLAVKRHMTVGGPLLRGKLAHIREVDPNEPSAPYLVDCDVVVTDYSSIVFDGYVLGKPSVLLAPDADLEAYQEARGFYLDYPRHYGGMRCRDARSLDIYMRAAAYDGMGDAEVRCRELTAGACDGHSTERVIEFVRGLL